MQETFGSTCHGAGRVMSRNDAIRSLDRKKIEENLNLYVNDIRLDFKPYDVVKNMDFSERRGGVYQLRIKIEKDRLLQNRLNSFDFELKDANSQIKFVIGTNENRILGYDIFTMDYCNRWDMMKSSNSYYYDGPNRHPLYNNPLIFLEIIK
ncbi:MAG: RtcB family protein [Deltaproteobacteria bacterium]|nr:RtcB family protein [Deltaproteobacteria bacterium]